MPCSVQVEVNFWICSNLKLKTNAHFRVCRSLLLISIKWIFYAQQIDDGLLNDAHEEVAALLLTNINNFAHLRKCWIAKLAERFMMDSSRVWWKINNLLYFKQIQHLKQISYHKIKIIKNKQFINEINLQLNQSIWWLKCSFFLSNGQEGPWMFSIFNLDKVSLKKLISAMNN